MYHRADNECVLGTSPRDNREYKVLVFSHLRWLTGRAGVAIWFLQVDPSELSLTRMEV